MALPWTHTSQNLLDVPATNSKRRTPRRPSRGGRRRCLRLRGAAGDLDEAVLALLGDQLLDGGAGRRLGGVVLHLGIALPAHGAEGQRDPPPRPRHLPETGRRPFAVLEAPRPARLRRRR